MEKVTRTQIPVLAAYSSPFVLLSAVIINTILLSMEITGGPLRLLVLGAAVPIGFSFGRIMYLRRSHVEIMFDENVFRVLRGSREVAQGSWKNYNLVSIALDQFGRSNLRLYKSIEGDFVELPISKTNAEPQKFRDLVQTLVSGRKVATSSLRVAEAF